LSFSCVYCFILVTSNSQSIISDLIEMYNGSFHVTILGNKYILKVILAAKSRKNTRNRVEN
jgi:ribosomal protein S17E